MLGIRLCERDDLLCRLARVAPDLRVHRVEKIEVREIDAAREQRGVVEPHPLEVAGRHRTELWTDLEHQGLARGAIQAVAERQPLMHGGIARMCLEGGIDIAVQLLPESGEDDF